MPPPARLFFRVSAIQEQLLYMNVHCFQGGLVFKARRLVHHSTLGLRVRNKEEAIRFQGAGCRVQGAGLRVQGSGFRVQGAGFRVQGDGLRVQGSGLRV